MAPQRASHRLQYLRSIRRGATFVDVVPPRLHLDEAQIDAGKQRAHYPVMLVRRRLDRGAQFPPRSISTTSRRSRRIHVPVQGESWRAQERKVKERAPHVYVRPHLPVGEGAGSQGLKEECARQTVSTQEHHLVGQEYHLLVCTSHTNILPFALFLEGVPAWGPREFGGLAGGIQVYLNRFEARFEVIGYGGESRELSIHELPVRI